MIKFDQQPNESGDPSRAAQGFGRVSQDPVPRFDPERDQDQAAAFFASEGYVVLDRALDAAELAQLNAFCARTQVERPAAWGLAGSRKPHHRNQGLIFSQPLLDYPELDPFTRHPRTFPLIERLLGGTGSARYSEFNFRETPADAGSLAMNFHHDAVLEDRLVRDPYLPCDWLCAIHYLSDVEPGSPVFCVVPRSRRHATLRDAFEILGAEYVECPLYGMAGTCILYDTATFHARLDGDGHRARRTLHQYFARGGWRASALPTTRRYQRAPTPVLTDWNLIPERLALHADPAIRLFFSHWNTAQCEWVASGFDPELRRAMPRGEQ